MQIERFPVGKDSCSVRLVQRLLESIEDELEEGTVDGTAHRRLQIEALGDQVDFYLWKVNDVLTHFLIEQHGSLKRLQVHVVGR